MAAGDAAIFGAAFFYSGLVAQSQSSKFDLHFKFLQQKPAQNVDQQFPLAICRQKLLAFFAAPSSAPMNTEIFEALNAQEYAKPTLPLHAVTTVRLSFYAQRLPALTVASAKSNSLTCFALLWLAALGVQKGIAGGVLSEFWQGISEPQAWLLVLWAALGPGALAAFLQTQVT